MNLKEYTTPKRGWMLQVWGGFWNDGVGYELTSIENGTCMWFNSWTERSNAELYLNKLADKTGGKKGDDECYKCASETQLGRTVYCRCKPEPKVTQFDKWEALDRISTIQGMLSLLLVDLNYEEGSRSHKGLSHDAEWLVSEAMEKLCEAYQAQGVFTFEENEND